MPKQIVLKNNKKQRSPTDYIKSLPKESQVEAKTLLKLFKDATGVKPKMWGNTMVGFGEYDYQRSNGDYGSYFATGFSIRKSGPTIYIMPGYKDYSKILAKIGPHKLGKSCLYLKKVSDIDLRVLAKIIKAGLKILEKPTPCGSNVKMHHMEKEETEFISIDQRQRLITVLENLEDKINKQNSLKRTFFKGVIYGLGTVFGATILVALFGGIIATTINTVVGDEVLSEQQINPSS